MNMRGFFCLVKHAEAYFVVNLQLKIDYAIHFGKFAKNLSIYEKTLANIRKVEAPATSRHTRHSLWLLPSGSDQVHELVLREDQGLH